MDISLLGLAKHTIPQIPLVIKTAILAPIGQSPNASVQDVLTEIITVAARPILSTPAPLLKSQAQFRYDYGIRGRMWISKYTIPAPPDPGVGESDILTVKEALSRAIKVLGGGEDDYEFPEVVDVEAEWTGYRGGVWHTAGRPRVEERKQYDMMMEEVEEGSPVILYFHGGAFW